MMRSGCVPPVLPVGAVCNAGGRGGGRRGLSPWPFRCFCCCSSPQMKRVWYAHQSLEAAPAYGDGTTGHSFRVQIKRKTGHLHTTDAAITFIITSRCSEAGVGFPKSHGVTPTSQDFSHPSVKQQLTKAAKFSGNSA
ncbi:hypothetical protein EJB05_46198 [Eragrostis curvula]|uniref:Uncharacterized protein n=1 Tax=Eragrostis curvula TaxID=38414 RepID=A0A5J9TMV1_9POAL|nr:hypothetical protein EJB05_46198 [Eragrostis curvula]